MYSAPILKLITIIVYIIFILIIYFLGIRYQIDIDIILILSIFSFLIMGYIISVIGKPKPITGKNLIDEYHRLIIEEFKKEKYSELSSSLLEQAQKNLVDKQKKATYQPPSNVKFYSDLINNDNATVKLRAKYQQCFTRIIDALNVFNKNNQEKDLTKTENARDKVLHNILKNAKKNGLHPLYLEVMLGQYVSWKSKIEEIMMLDKDYKLSQIEYEKRYKNDWVNIVLKLESHALLGDSFVSDDDFPTPEKVLSILKNIGCYSYPSNSNKQ